MAHDLQADVSTVSRYLATLAGAGLARKERHGKEVFYWPRRHLYVTFVGPLSTDGADGSRSWDLVRWTSSAPVDWRFPLVSRLPDAAAQQCMTKLLEAMGDSGFFQPWLVGRASPDRARGGIRLHPTTTAGAAGFAYEVIVFGSCARGDARDDSDLDVLVVGPSAKTWAGLVPGAGDGPDLSWREPLQLLVGELNIGAPRAIDLIMADLDHPDSLPERLMAQVQRDGMTVYSTRGGPFWFESRRS